LISGGAEKLVRRNVLEKENKVQVQIKDKQTPSFGITIYGMNKFEVAERIKNFFMELDKLSPGEVSDARIIR
jgi:hypothetical protein